MKGVREVTKARFGRLSFFLLLSVGLFAGTAFWGGTRVAANHPVLVEGNCESPIPGTTQVPVVPGTGGSTSGGICGDYDGDGRLGTAEDTDGADRIFGTLTAALGPGVGPAAGTGANQNGTVLIVTSGRFAESLVLGNAFPGYIGGCDPAILNNCTVPGNVTIEAAPGVVANIDAVLQGDAPGANNARQAQSGIVIHYPDPATADRVVTLRNLTIRNFGQGIGTFGFNKILVDNCRIDNNVQSGIIVTGFHSLVVTRSKFQGNGRRIGTAPNNAPNLGDGLRIEGNAVVKVFDSAFSNNAGAGIRNNTGSPLAVTLFKVGTYFNGTDIAGTFTISPDPNYSN